MFNKINEEAAKNMIGPMMNMIQDSVSDIKPENEVSVFIEDNMRILFKQKQENDMIGGASGLLEKLMVNEANNDFKYSLDKLLEFYESFRIFYSELIKRANENKPVLLNEDDKEIDEALADKEDIDKEDETEFHRPDNGL